ncbi:MAG TPA: PEP-CTERM sorting domain-containing protein [Lacipirellulaceae bacterium]|nr:PEP-CTERM sorting domain-containing protein [Lacipirellulaceae bacterium]HMP04944.1 PEP-CTERM sorting domain-containing protein [Lacipirellulaceae bacterium]
MLRRSPLAVLALLASYASGALASDLISITFESGNLAPANSAADGWKFWDAGAPGADLAKIGNTGRTFLTGTPGNDEAIFIKPATPNVSNNDLVGAEFRTSTPITINATDRIYVVTEAFSDVAAFSDQFMKIDVRFGLAGDGLAYGGFDGTLGGSTFSVNDNYNTEPTGINQQARISLQGSPTGQVQDNKYIGNDVQFGAADNNPGTPANNFLDRTYLVKTVYVPDATGSTVKAYSQGNGFDGTDIVSTYNRTALNSDAGTGVRIFNGYASLTIDRVSVHFRRHVGTNDGPGGNVDQNFNGFAGFTGFSSTADLVGDPATNPFYIVNNAADLMFGLKSIRIGVAEPTDLNLDGVTDAADLAIAQGNLGLTNATFFDGDVNGDGVVDANDLAFFNLPGPGDFDGNGLVDGADFLAWQQGLGGAYSEADLDAWITNFGSGGSFSAAPEPGSLTLLAAGVLGVAARRRRNAV